MAALQSRTRVGHVRHQAAQLPAHQPQLVFLGCHTPLAVAAEQLGVSHHAAQRAEHAVEEQPQQDSAQHHREHPGNSHDPSGQQNSTFGVRHGIGDVSPVQGDQLPAEILRLLEQPAMALLKQQGFGLLPRSRFVGCDRLGLLRIQLDPGVLQAAQKSFFLGGNNRGTVNRGDPLVKMSQQLLQLFFPNRISLVKEVSAQQCVPLEEHDFSFFRAEVRPVLFGGLFQPFVNAISSV